MKRLASALFAAGLGGLVALPTAARAEHPSMRYCEAGATGADAGSTPVDFGTFESEVDFGSGRGFFGGCKAGLILGVHLYGEYRKLKTSSETTFFAEAGDTLATLDLNLDADVVRIGAGWSIDLPRRLTPYGQLGLIYTDVTSEASATDGLQTVTDGASGDAVGLDAEAGLRWAAVKERVELEASIRYVSDAAITVKSETGLELDSDVIGSFGAAIRTWGPVWIVGRYEIADTDIGLVGLRVAF